MIRKYIEVKFVKVAAHTGNKYNEMADDLAKRAISLFQGKKSEILLQDEKTLNEETMPLGIIHETAINNGKLGMLNINFPYRDKNVSMIDIHELFKKKCKKYKITLKNIKHLSIQLKSTYDQIEYCVENDIGEKFSICIEFRR